MNLYRVKLTIDTVVACEKEDYAIAAVGHDVNSIVNTIIERRAPSVTRIHSEDDLPPDWTPETTPWGFDPEFRTIGEILEAPNPGHEPEEERGRV